MTKTETIMARAEALDALPGHDDDDSEVLEEGHAGRLVVAGWWAEKEGWI